MESYLGNPNLKKVNQPKEWTQKEILEYQKCMEDPLYFIQTYIKIVSLDEALIPFKPYTFQKDMIVVVLPDCLGSLHIEKRLL